MIFFLRLLWLLGCAESSALPLLMPRVVANDANDALAPDHLALVANLFDGRTDLHS
jgi:hypothetical protein